MRRNRLTSRPRLFTGLLSALLFSSWAIPFAAQVAPEIRAEPGFTGYDATHETTLAGTIQDVILEHVVGSRPGCICWWPAGRASWIRTSDVFYARRQRKSCTPAPWSRSLGLPYNSKIRDLFWPVN